MQNLRFKKRNISQILKDHIGEEFTIDNIQNWFLRMKRANFGQYFKKSYILEFVKSDNFLTIEGGRVWYPKIGETIFVDLPVSFRIKDGILTEVNEVSNFIIPNFIIS